MVPPTTTSPTTAPADGGSLHDGADEVLVALFAMLDAVQANAEWARALADRVEFIRTLRAEGRPYREIVPFEPRPLIVEILTENLERLALAGARLRRVEARALYEEGMTMAEIASFFGVTHQRVSMILRDVGP